MKTLTATNQRVQFYLTYTTERPTTAAKRSRLNALRASLEERNVMLDELFPRKQLAVLDRILYITSGVGIAKVGADNLALKCDVSIRTVTNAVRALKQTGEFIIARLIKSQGGAGKYIIVDKKHANFREIMREVFCLSDYKFAQLNAEQIAEQKTEETVEAVSVEHENESSNYIISYNSKQVKDKYISCDANAIKETIEENSTPGREYVVEYASNPRQIDFYDVLDSMPYQKSIKSVQHVLALRIGSDCDTKRFNKAKDIVHSIAMQIAEGYIFENIVAVFSAALEKAVQYDVVAPIPVDKRPVEAPKVPFYDWLRERD